jgi:Domain of unknown function (DUF4132)
MKAGHVIDDWPMAKVFGLSADGGWVDCLKLAWTNSTPVWRSHWEEIIALCRDAQPGSGSDWTGTQHEIESLCGYPPDPFAGQQSKPEPGTDAYQRALDRAVPDEAWRIKVRTLKQKAGHQVFAAEVARLFQRAVHSGIGTLNRNAPNREILRGLIWSVVVDAEICQIDALRQLSIWSLAHKTAQASTIGILLAFTSSAHAAAALRMIELSAKRPMARTRFGRYASHVERRLGISPATSLEQFVPTFELGSNGTRRVSFGEAGAAELRVEKSQGVLRYFNSSGKQLAAAPKAVKLNHGQAVHELQASVKGLGQVIRAQRERIESLLLEKCSWDFSTWQLRYLEHPVVAEIARQLIWNIDGSPRLFVNGQATDIRGHLCACSPTATITLWHPVDRSVAEIEGWRRRIESLNLTQPFKQAHREVYLLTDAERHTSTYSNRFAGHILRQSQFRALARSRKWQTQLIGSWDDGGSDSARREFTGEWRIEWWTSAAGEGHAPGGGLYYISTDQVRFYRGNNPEPVPLETVPKPLLSEAMRDVDLFVGVASIGSDPAWQDRGEIPGGGAYWQSFSFGDLNASAKTRKEVLERLLPKLKIATQCSFDEKFLIVRGMLRTYKIHLDSGNIQMEPNNQYLCIVRKQGEAGAEPLVLPFEGDRTLSLILSKAFLLAEDSKIKDPTILSQIKVN